VRDVGLAAIEVDGGAKDLPPQVDDPVCLHPVNLIAAGRKISQNNVVHIRDCHSSAFVIVVRSSRWLALGLLRASVRATK
jgi:hypothetical protein